MGARQDAWSVQPRLRVGRPQAVRWCVFAAPRCACLVLPVSLWPPQPLGHLRCLQPRSQVCSCPADQSDHACALCSAPCRRVPILAARAGARAYTAAPITAAPAVLAPQVSDATATTTTCSLTTSDTPPTRCSRPSTSMHAASTRARRPHPAPPATRQHVTGAAPCCCAKTAGACCARCPLLLLLLLLPPACCARRAAAHLPRQPT
jgi:hypothetical protein